MRHLVRLRMSTAWLLPPDGLGKILVESSGFDDVQSDAKS